MAAGKEIRGKIKSVENTKKITKAMEMVAASKMRKAQQRMRAARPYSEKIRNIAANLGKANPEYTHPFMQKNDAKSAGIVDNDWVELFNINGAIAARAVVSQRVNPGMVMMYHAQEKIINTPGSEITGARGGIHNSVTRIVLKPTHMIGGYAQFSYGFNYYGTIGTNRDEFVVVRKMNKVDWLDGTAATSTSTGAHA